MKEKQNIYHDEVVISTNKPTLFKLTYTAKGFKGVLQKLGLIKKYKHIEFYPITLGQRLRFSTEIDIVAKQVMSDKNIDDLDIKSLIKSLAILIHRENSNPPKRLYDVLENLSDAEFEALVVFIYNSLQTESFLKSIILMIKMSLKAEEIIADEKDLTHGSLKET